MKQFSFDKTPSSISRRGGNWRGECIHAWLVNNERPRRLATQEIVPFRRAGSEASLDHRHKAAGRSIIKQRPKDRKTSALCRGASYAGVVDGLVAGVCAIGVEL